MKNMVTVSLAEPVRGTERTMSTPGARTLYWVATMYIGATSSMAGVAGLLRAPMVFGMLRRLGYPPHFVTLLATWELAGAAALCAPRYPLLKEWAYAGMFINFSGAIVAHASAGDGARALIAPALSMGALIVSWSLRPASRRLARAQQ